MSDANAQTRDQIVLFHLSDIHVGDGPLPSPFKTFNFGYLEGYNPHDHRLLWPLENALESARSFVGLDKSEPINVVISGDLTKSGVDNDYATVFALLHHRWQWKFGHIQRWLGFGWPRERTFTVPGNHDHWRHERRPIAHARGMSPDFFEPTPWKHVIESTGGGLRLELFGIDSNSGLEQPGKPEKRNLFARGAMSEEEYRKLEEMLAGSPAQRTEPDVVRALVCHHSFKGNTKLPFPLVDQSRAEICTLAQRYDIAAVLTGHTHDFGTRSWPLDPAASGPSSLKELRCATTLQATRVKPGLQGFWLHRIARLPGSSSEWEWTAWKYQVGGKDYDLDAHDVVRFSVPTVRRPPDP